MVDGCLAVGMTAVSDILKQKVSSKEEYAFTAFTGAITGAISGGIDNAKRLGKGAKLLSEAVSGFIIGTGEDAARQALVEGKEEVDGTRSVIKGIINAGLAIAVPIILKGAKAGLNKIKTPGVNTVVGEDVIGKGVKETSEEVVEESLEKGAKSLSNNIDDTISNGVNEVAEKQSKSLVSNTDNIPRSGYYKEVYANTPVKADEVVKKWDEFLGTVEYTDIHPRT